MPALTHIAMTVALCSPGAVRLRDAQALALAATPMLTAEARARGSMPYVAWSGRTSYGWSFELRATHPCRPGQAVCSSLVGHYSVDKRSLRVQEDDLDQTVTTNKVRSVAAAIERSRCGPRR